MSEILWRLFDGGIERRLSVDEPLFHAGDSVGQMYLVTGGRMALVRQTSAGTSVILQQAGSGQVLAEASAYAAAYHCDARAAAATSLRAVPVATFRDRLARDPEAAVAWAGYLANAVQVARMRSEIRTLRTVAERLDAWLGASSALPERGTWTSLAAELGVSREALYRELGRRREGGS